jgi:hypothetical protein
VTEAENVSRALAGSIEALAAELLPGGHREGHEWRAGSIKGEAGGSLGVHLSGHKPGIWSDFATGDGGDALDLVKAVYDFDTRKALAWARRWLGIDTGTAELPCRFPPASAVDDRLDRDRWRWPWQAARPIGGTLADAYLAARGLHFDDAAGRVLRFAERRARRSPAGEIDIIRRCFASYRTRAPGSNAGSSTSICGPMGVTESATARARRARAVPAAPSSCCRTSANPSWA